jgi:hypothetical protein
VLGLHISPVKLSKNNGFVIVQTKSRLIAWIYFEHRDLSIKDRVPLIVLLGTPLLFAAPRESEMLALAALCQRCWSPEPCRWRWKGIGFGHLDFGSLNLELEF